MKTYADYCLENKGAIEATTNYEVRSDGTLKIIQFTVKDFLKLRKSFTLENYGKNFKI